MLNQNPQVVMLTNVEKKSRLPKGFLTKNGEPTMNAVLAYYLYLSHGGTKKDETIRLDIVEKIRNAFNVDGDFSTMLHWGMYPECYHSKTSQGRAIAMRKALVIAEICFSQTVM